MAVTRFFHTSDPPGRLIRYVSDPLKTSNGMYVTALGSGAKSPEQAWEETKAYYGKKNGVTAWHVIQSFPHDSVTPELAHEIGIQFIDRFVPEHDALIATHLDKQHVHNHLVFDSVSRLDGKKYPDPMSDIYRIKRISDEICLAHNLPVIREKRERVPCYYNWKLVSLGLPTGRDLLNRCVREALSLSLDRDDFFSLMEERGFTASRSDGRLFFIPKGKKLRFTARLDDRLLTDAEISKAIEQGLSDLQPDPGQDELNSSVPEPPPVSPDRLSTLYERQMFVIRNGKPNYTEIEDYLHYTDELSYLRDNQIDTLPELTERKNTADEKIASLLERRSVLPRKPETKEERLEISRSLRKLRNEARLLDRIAESTERMRKAFVKERFPELAEDRLFM